MADQSDDLRPEGEMEEDGGGPIKPFLEHLEDLRWTLIQIVVAITIGMILCLIAGDFIMRILKKPLEKAERLYPATNPVVAIQFGTNWFGPYKLYSNNIASLGITQSTAFELAPVTIGSNTVLAIRPSTNPIPENLQGFKVKLLNLGPAGGFIVAFKLAIYGGVVLASPFVIYILARFIVPALRLKEKKYIGRGFAVGTVLFALGVSFCYYVLMPLALNASVKYSNWLGLEAENWNAEEYISFVCKFMLGMGLGFEMPVIILILVKLGIVNYSQLASFRRYMIVINLILGAVLTTPEVLTQVMMAIPLQILYEVSVWIAWYWERKERKREQQQGLLPPTND